MVNGFATLGARRVPLLLWPAVMLLGLTAGACTLFSGPSTVATRPPDPLTIVRSRIREERTTATTARQCELDLHEALLDLLENRPFPVNSESRMKNCPPGWSDGPGGIRAALEGDPWTMADRLLHFLEATSNGPGTNMRDPAVGIWRLLAAALLIDQDPADMEHVLRLLELGKKDPGLPVLGWTGHPVLLGLLAEPDPGLTGTGLVFSASRSLITGRRSFQDSSRFSGEETWTDGQPVSSLSGHPEAFRLTREIRCDTDTELLVEIRPDGPAAVYAGKHFSASSLHTPLVEEDLWRLLVPIPRGTHLLEIRLLARNTLRRPRIRVLPTAAGCNLPGKPVHPMERFVDLPEWMRPLHQAAMMAYHTALGHLGQARETAHDNPRLARIELATRLHSLALLKDPSLTPEVSRKLLSELQKKHEKTGWAIWDRAMLLSRHGRYQDAISLLFGLSTEAALTRATELSLQAGLTFNAPDPGKQLASFRHYQSFRLSSRQYRISVRDALARLAPAMTLRPDLTDRIPLYQGAFRFREAVFEANRLLEIWGPVPDLLARSADACLGLGDISCAISRLETLLAVDPARESAFIKWFDLQTVAGNLPDPRAILLARLARYPINREVLQLAWNAGLFRPSDLPPVKELLAMNWGLDAAAVFLLNREEHFLYPEGGGFFLTTRWVRLNSPVAVEELGELQLPPDAIVLDVHTLKPDGRVFPPSSIPQKSGFSLRNLEPGDIIVFSTLRIHPGISGLPGRTWVNRFQFTHPAFPTVQSEWILRAPGSVSLSVQPRGRLPDISRTTQNGEQILRLAAFTLERTLSEPRMTGHEPPSIAAQAGFSREDLVLLLAEEEPHADRDSTEVARLAKQLCPKKATPCIFRTSHWVMDHIRDERSELRAATILQRRSGSRAHLLFALLRHQGFDVRMLLARTGRAGSGVPDIPDPADFPLWLLHIPEFGFVDPRFSRLPVGSMVPALGGTQAIVLASPFQTETLPEADTQWRHLLARVRLETDKSAHFTVEDRSSGFHAVQKLEQFIQADPKRLWDQVQSDSLHRYFPGARLLEWQWKKPPRHQAELLSSLTFTAPSVLAGIPGNKLEMRRFLFPWNLRRRFSVYASRKTDFLPNALPDTRTELRILPPAGHSFEPGPDLNLETAYGTLRRKLRVQKDGSATLVVEKQLRHEVVPVSRWKEFASFAQLFDEYETLPVVLIPDGSGGEK